MKKYFLWLTFTLCGASLSAAPVSQASKDWVRREIAAAISAAGKATVVENADGSRTCSSPFTCDTIPDAVSISLTFSPVRVIRNGVVTVVPFSLADLFISRAFAQAAENGEQPPDIVLTIIRGFYETKNLDNEGNPISVPFDFGSGLELTLQVAELPKKPNERHTCEIDSTCHCKGYGKSQADFIGAAEKEYPTIRTEEFASAYGLFDSWINTGTWPDVTTNPRTKEKRYWVHDVNGERIALDVIDGTEAWVDGLLDTLKDINSWMDKCREAYCKAKICDKENPQHDWEVQECGSIVWKKCRRNASHTEGAEDHEMAIGKFDAAFHFCACGKVKEPHTLSVGERELKADGTGWRKTTICLDGCGFTKTINHTCKHEKCQPCSGGDGCDLVCPTCSGQHDFSANPTSRNCTRCACDGCGLTQRQAGIAVTRDKHTRWDNCGRLDSEENNRSAGEHCCCECGDYSHANNSQHEREAVAVRYENTSAEEDPKREKHWKIWQSDCKYCGDKQGVLYSHTYGEGQDGEKPKRYVYESNEGCIPVWECLDKCGHEASRKLQSHVVDPEAPATYVATENGVCRGYYRCKNCVSEFRKDGEHVRNPADGCTCRNKCGEQLDHVYDQVTACGNKKCACGKVDPSAAEVHIGSITLGDGHACECGGRSEGHFYGEWEFESADGEYINYIAKCVRTSWGASGCGAVKRKQQHKNEPTSSCVGDQHYALPTACGCECGKYGADNPHPEATFHKFGNSCLCACEHYHREVESPLCDGICNYCARPAKSGIASDIPDAPASAHTPCTVADGRCGCRCNHVTHVSRDERFHVFRAGECRCLGANGSGGDYHRHMPDASCRGVCSVQNAWGIDGQHTVAGATVEAYHPTKATAAAHTKTQGSACGCECRTYNNENADEWRFFANLHNSDPNRCGCFCDKASEYSIPEYHKYLSNKHCVCECEEEHRLIKHPDGLCARVCFGLNHGEGQRGNHYARNDEEGKNTHTPNADECGCECGEFHGIDYTTVGRFHCGFGEGREECICKCGQWHQYTEGNPCIRVCNSCDRIAKIGNTPEVRLATAEDHTAGEECCGCVCGKKTTPHRHGDDECYCYGKYSPDSKYDFVHGEKALIEHLNLALTSTLITNNFSCLHCGETRTDILREYRCDNNHFVTSNVPEHVCAVVQCQANCDCCDHTDENPCDCPFCNSVEGSSGQCTCAGRTMPPGTFKITNPVLTAEDFAELFAKIDSGEVENVDGDDPVYEIADRACQSGFANMPNLATVKFNFATNVGVSAFQLAFNNCPRLTSIQFARLERAADLAFASAFWGTGVVTLDFPALKSVGIAAFSQCATVESIRIPLVETLSNSLFSDCGRLFHVDAPNAKCVRPYAFVGCGNLEQITLPNVTDIDSGAFADSNLKKIHLPKIPRASIDISSPMFPIGCEIHFADETIVYGQ